MWKQRIISSLWWLLGLTLCVLLMAGIQYKKHLPCSDIKVNIESVKGHVFIDEQEITQILKKNGAAIDKFISDIHLQELESVLKQQPWIFNAELFFDNNQVLNVNILEREPLARIFTTQGNSFYIDSSGMQLPLSNDYSDRVPIFTGFTSTKKKLSNSDNLLISDIKNIASIILQDSFWNPQVSQVNITPNKTFEITPVLGNQVIKLGNADSLQSKFDRLTAFYKQIWSKSSFEKYESISVEFSGQIVAVKRGMVKPIIDIEEAHRLISIMQSGEDIVEDTMTATPIFAIQPNIPNKQTDTVNVSKKKTGIQNKTVKTNNRTKTNKPLLASKRATKVTKKAPKKTNKKVVG